METILCATIIFMWIMFLWELLLGIRQVYILSFTCMSTESALQGCQTFQKDKEKRILFPVATISSKMLSNALTHLSVA